MTLRDSVRRETREQGVPRRNHADERREAVCTAHPTSVEYRLLRVHPTRLPYPALLIRSRRLKVASAFLANRETRDVMSAYKAYWHAILVELFTE